MQTVQDKIPWTACSTRLYHSLTGRSSASPICHSPSADRTTSPSQ